MRYLTFAAPVWFPSGIRLGRALDTAKAQRASTALCGRLAPIVPQLVSVDRSVTSPRGKSHGGAQLDRTCVAPSGLCRCGGSSQSDTYAHSRCCASSSEHAVLFSPWVSSYFVKPLFVFNKSPHDEAPVQSSMITDSTV